MAAERLFSREHLWVKREDGRVLVGISDYAQRQLGDVVYVELPEVGREISRGQAFGVAESVKSVSDLYAPVGGRVLAVNEALLDRPELLNEDPYGEGWILVLELRNPEELDSLLGEDEYTAEFPGG